MQPTKTSDLWWKSLQSKVSENIGFQSVTYEAKQPNKT